MAKDPIIDEIRKNRREIAEKFGYDLRAIIADARKRQKGRGKRSSPLLVRKERSGRSDSCDGQARNTAVTATANVLSPASWGRCTRHNIV